MEYEVNDAARAKAVTTDANAESNRLPIEDSDSSSGDSEQDGNGSYFSPKQRTQLTRLGLTVPYEGFHVADNELTDFAWVHKSAAAILLVSNLEMFFDNTTFYKALKVVSSNRAAAKSLTRHMFFVEHREILIGLSMLRRLIMQRENQVLRSYVDEGLRCKSEDAFADIPNERRLDDTFRPDLARIFETNDEVDVNDFIMPRVEPQDAVSSKPRRAPSPSGDVQARKKLKLDPEIKTGMAENDSDTSEDDASVPPKGGKEKPKKGKNDPKKQRRDLVKKIGENIRILKGQVPGRSAPGEYKIRKAAGLGNDEWVELTKTQALAGEAQFPPEKIERMPLPPSWKHPLTKDVKAWLKQKNNVVDYIASLQAWMWPDEEPQEEQTDVTQLADATQGTKDKQVQAMDQTKTSLNEEADRLTATQRELEDVRNELQDVEDRLTAAEGDLEKAQRETQKWRDEAKKLEREIQILRAFSDANKPEFEKFSASRKAAREAKLQEIKQKEEELEKMKADLSIWT